MGSLGFFIDIILPAVLDFVVNSAPNDYQGYIMGVKAAGA